MKALLRGTLLALAFSLTACDRTYIAQQQKLAARLRLEISEPGVFAIGQESQLQARVRNVSDKTAVGCVAGQGLTCWLRADRSHGWATRFIVARPHMNHPRCTSPFHLDPGEAQTWQVPAKLDGFPLGTGTFGCSLEVSTGKHCDHFYGCYTSEVSSPKFPVDVVQSAAVGASTSPQATSPQPAQAPDVRALTLASKVFGNSRAIRVYLPPGYDARESASTKYPVLYLNDGFAVFSERLWDAPHLLDGLIREGSVKPLILVGIDSAATIEGAKNPGRDRTMEYLPYPDPLEPEVPSPRGEQYPQFLFGEVMPLVERTFRVDPGDVGLGGSSYGAIAALYACEKAPRHISRLMLESAPLFLFGERLIGEISRAAWPSRVYVGIGTKETEDKEIAAKGATATAHFIAAAKSATGEVVLNQVEGASHNAAAWKARLPAAMRFLYGALPTPQNLEQPKGQR